MNLEAQAKIAFRWSPELERQFTNAQLMFPEVLALYSGSSCTPRDRHGVLLSPERDVRQPDRSRQLRDLAYGELLRLLHLAATCGGGGTPNVRRWKRRNAVRVACASPVTFTNQSYQSGNLGTGATCHETTANLAGLVCGNYSSSRTFSVNGGSSAAPARRRLPAKRNGGYRFQASAGDYAWAYPPGEQARRRERPSRSWLGRSRRVKARDRR